VIRVSLRSQLAHMPGDSQEDPWARPAERETYAKRRTQALYRDPDGNELGFGRRWTAVSFS
jgi:hypothetical protein